MVCGEAHLTGSKDCKGKFRRLHRPGTQQHGAPNNKTSKPSGNGGASSGKFRQATGPATGNKTSYSEKNKNRKASTRSAKSGARTKAPPDNAGISHPWKAPTQRLTEPQAQNGPSEPMQQAEPADHDDRASVASGSSSVSQCSGRTSGTLQQELPHMLQRITPAVTDSVLSTVQKRSSVQYESSRSRSRSPPPDSRRRRGVPCQTTGSLEHSPAAPCPEMMVPLPEAPSPSGVGPRNKVIVEKFEIIQWNCRGFRSWKKRSHLQLYLQTLGTAPRSWLFKNPAQKLN
ncbi:hypothetical protein HPB47_006096 [Ixodes persulcatus]|uniref:Uncharacterized protein n=1 Tax=Ixodes persulcatus TaxID=34615 RepID=A0AC60PCB8_IXOPE|nr:hypothetical protein HPB47_006096 [Ixodes persulcatus]